MRFQANRLRLVYPPISNQEGEWLWKIPAVREQVRSSKLYMIGQRAELIFDDFNADQGDFVLEFTLRQLGTENSMHWRVPLRAILPDHYDGEIDVELGPKLIRVWGEDSAPDGEPLAWFTPDKLLYNAWNGHIPVQQLSEHKEFLTFDLLYVGISKAGDSFTRLIDSGHDARGRILSNERQRYPTSRVTDEMTLFLFDIERIGIRYLDIDELARVDVGEDFRPDPIRVFADAEKAFVKVLNPQYNEVRYQSYPRGTDGLYGEGLARYAYAIAEDLVFLTPGGEIHGGVREGDYDVILVEGDEVRVWQPSREPENPNE
jgi:hypothetical protein